jgi:dolichol-phosphate mannosyltransferase
MKTLIVTPTYNERENIETLLGLVHTIIPEAHVLVVDDNSPDGTGDYVGHRSVDEEWVHLLARAGKLGLGTAY